MSYEECQAFKKLGIFLMLRLTYLKGVIIMIITIIVIIIIIIIINAGVN